MARARVRVCAVDSSGKPVPGVELAPLVMIKAGKLSAVNVSQAVVKARTNGEGIATFDWFPRDVDSNTNFFLVAGSSYSMRDWPRWETDKPDALVTAKLLKLTPVSGRVMRPDGSAAAGIVVAARSERLSVYPGGSGTAITAVDGSYSMILPPEESYTVGVADDEWSARSQTGLGLQEGQPLHGVNFQLVRGGLIRGLVTLRKTGQPAPGQVVMLIEATRDDRLQQAQSAGRGPARTVYTDGDGRYAFRVAPGRYDIGGPYYPIIMNGEGFKISSGEDVHKDLKLPILALPQRTIRGVVRAGQPGAAPIGRAVVVIEPIDSQDRAFQAFADGDGRFELPRPSGRCLVYARSPTGDLAGMEILGDHGEREVPIMAQPAAIGRGQVVDGAGKPYVQVRVVYAVLPGWEAADGFSGALQCTSTDNQGRFIARAARGRALQRHCVASGRRGPLAQEEF